MTNVKFLIEKGNDTDNGTFENEVFAFFPNDLHNFVDLKMFVSYAHLGQHSACHIDYAKECKEADFNQYNDLLRELIGQGYNDLHILNSQLIECHRQPTESEVKFGEGATHYRSFTAGEMGITKKGDLKKWFVADDGLRYYTR